MFLKLWLDKVAVRVLLWDKFLGRDGFIGVFLKGFLKKLGGSYVKGKVMVFWEEILLSYCGVMFRSCVGKFGIGLNYGILLGRMWRVGLYGFLKETYFGFFVLFLVILDRTKIRKKG